MKKILALLLVVALVLSLGACTRRPATTPGANDPQNNISSTEPDSSKTPDEPENTPAQDTEPEETPEQDTQPSETPEQDTKPEESPEPSEEPEESPEPSEEPEESPEPSEKPAENPNEGKVDSGAAMVSTATDLAPADDSFLALIPELPYENWASTGIDSKSIMLELSGLGGDAQTKLLEYIQTLRDEEFEVTEYIYGCLYEASNDKVIVTIMLDAGTLSVTIEKK